MTSTNSTSITKDRPIWRVAPWKRALRYCGLYAAAAIARLKVLAPYALIELILPGGSVMALLLWLYRQRKNGSDFRRVPVRLLPAHKYDLSHAAFLRQSLRLARVTKRHPSTDGQ
jgi:hypothetical protein